MVLGIDIGGTTVKCGLVDKKGIILEKEIVNTAEASTNGLFVEKLADIIDSYKQRHPELLGVGLGFPGLLSKDRTSIVNLPNIPGVKAQNVVDKIAERIPGLQVVIENDAKCATMGEKIFGDPSLDNFMFITLGTGVGSGLVLDNKLFLGARGNATEIGHMITSTGLTLEEQIGHRQIGEYAVKCLNLEQFSNSILQGNTKLSPKILFDAAEKGDILATHVFEHVGKLLGETLVNVIRVIDIDTFLLGGGVAGAFDYMVPSAIAFIKANMPAYYTDSLVIKKAILKEEAGLLGAASLIYHHFETY